MSAQWVLYEQHCGRGRWVAAEYVREDDDAPTGAGWEPFAAFALSGAEVHGTHVIVWRRQMEPEGAGLRALMKAAGHG